MREGDYRIKIKVKNKKGKENMINRQTDRQEGRERK